MRRVSGWFGRCHLKTAYLDAPKRSNGVADGVISLMPTVLENMRRRWKYVMADTGDTIWKIEKSCHYQVHAKLPYLDQTIIPG